VRVITFVPYPTQIFQVLDLRQFGVRKRRSRYELPFENDSATVEFMMKVYHDLKQTIVPSNVWGAFYALGRDFGTMRESYMVLFDEEKLRGSAGVPEL
jgi:hypothetical protein